MFTKFFNSFNVDDAIKEGIAEFNQLSGYGKRNECHVNADSPIKKSRTAKLKNVFLYIVLVFSAAKG